jgi:hypothetical protein
MYNIIIHFKEWRFKKKMSADRSPTDPAHQGRLLPKAVCLDLKGTLSDSPSALLVIHFLN